MPGKRNLARERAHHDAPARFASLHALLTAQLPHHDRALIGRAAILNYLHDRLHLRRLNRGPITWRMVMRWRRLDGLPLLRGFTSPRYATPALSTEFALTAWILSLFSSGDPERLRVCCTHLDDHGERSSGFARRVA